MVQDWEIGTFFEDNKKLLEGITDATLPMGLLMNQEAIMNAIDPMSQAEKSKLAAEEIEKALLHVKASSEVVAASQPILDILERLLSAQGSTIERLDTIDKRLDALETKSCCTIS